MKVVIVTYMGYDGPGVMHAHHFANCLVERGHDVLVLVNGDASTVKLMAGAPKYDLEEVSFQDGRLAPRVRGAAQHFSPDVIHMWTPRHLPARVGLELAVEEGAKLIIHFEDDEEYILEHFGGNRRFSQDDLALYRLMAAERLDAAELERLAPSIDAEFMRLTVLDPPTWSWLHPIVSAIAFRLADAFTVISSPHRALLGSQSTKPSMLLYPGVDMRQFAAGRAKPSLLKKLGLENRLVLLYSGAISGIHDFTSYLEALPMVVKEHPEVSLVQVGRNDIPDVTDRMLEELGISDNVVFTGAIPHYRMVDYLALADVYLAPVRPDRFNQHRLPSKIPEYMAMGRPMLISEESFGLALDDEQEVVKVKTDAPEELASALEHLLERKDMWAQMGERLRDKATQLFDWETNTARLVDLYEETMGDETVSQPEGIGDLQPSRLDELGYMAPPRQSTRAKLASDSRLRKRVVMFTDGRIGLRMSGIGIRYWEIAHALSEHCDVALGHRYEDKVDGTDVELFSWADANRDQALARARAADVLMVHGYILEKLPELRELHVPLVVDLYCPFVFENLELHRDLQRTIEEREPIHANDLRVLVDQLHAGDYFLCCTESQRDWIIGMLTAINRLRPSTYAPGMQPDDLVGLVPFGLPSRPPVPAEGRNVLKGVWPGIEAGDTVLIWGGGIWSWLDAKTVIRAMGLVAQKRPDVKLMFLSTGSAEPDLVEMPSVREAIDLADELRLTGRSVIFNDRGYIEYERRSAYFLESDIGVCAHRQSLETHYAFRTRVLDYLHCGLPIITSRGDYFGKLVEDEHLGRAIDPEDPAAWADAILDLVENRDELGLCRERVLSARDRFTWPQVTAPLMEFCLRGKDRGLPAGGVEMFSSRASLPTHTAEPISTEVNQPLSMEARDLEDLPTNDVYVQVLSRIQGMRNQIAQLTAHANALEDRHQHALDVLRVLQVQIALIRKIPFSQSLWRLIRRVRYPQLRG